MYLAYNGINNDYEECNTLKEAQDYLKEVFLDPNEGYHPDLGTCKIYKLAQKVTYNVIADKKDFTDEEWKDEGYSLEFDEIWKHKFENI